MPFPWKIEVEGFEATIYTEADARQERPIVLRALGKMRGMLERPGRNEKERFSWLLKRSDLSRAEEIEFEASADGRFEISVPAGIYQGAVLGRRSASRIRSGLIVRAGRSTDVGRVLCQQTMAVSFRVLDAKSQAVVPGAVVHWDPPDLQNSDLARLLFARPWSSVADARGGVVFSSIGPLPIAARWRIEAKGFASAQTPRIILREGGKSAVPDVELRGDATVVVRVTLPRGAKMPRGTLILQDPDSANPIRFVPKASALLREGETKFTSVTYGPKRVLLQTGSGQKICYTDFNVFAETTIVDVSLEPVVIHGAVTRGGKPAAGYDVRLADPHDAKVELAKAKSDPEGQYSLTTYQTGHLDLYAIGWKGPGTASGAGRGELEVIPGQRDYEVNFKFPVAALTVVVTDASTGLPIPRARVDKRLDFGASHSMGINDTDESGRLTLSDYPEGTATLHIRARGYKAKELVLPIREDGTEFAVALEPSKGISGSVVGPERQPVAGARVTGGYRNEFSHQAFFYTSTDELGRFHFDSAPQAGTTFYVAAQGYALDLATLQPGDDNNITLSPLSPGVLYVVTQKGPPASGLRIVAAPRGGEVIPSGALVDLAELNGMDEYQLLATGPDGVVGLPAFLGPGSYDFYVTLKGESSLRLFKKLGSLDLPLQGPAILVYDSAK